MPLVWDLDFIVLICVVVLVTRSFKKGELNSPCNYILRKGENLSAHPINPHHTRSYTLSGYREQHMSCSVRLGCSLWIILASSDRWRKTNTGTTPSIRQRSHIFNQSLIHRRLASNSSGIEDKKHSLGRLSPSRITRQDLKKRVLYIYICLRAYNLPALHWFAELWT
jgi:hypothetical protein